jgi:hypothetical protein
LFEENASHGVISKLFMVLTTITFDAIAHLCEVNCARSERLHAKLIGRLGGEPPTIVPWTM